MKCHWCGKPNRRPSDWEQESLKGGWYRLCVRCANVRLRNPYSALLTEVTRVMRKVATSEAESVNEPDQYPNGLVSPCAVLARQNLSDLAAVWNDHPGYRAEWKL